MFERIVQPKRLMVCDFEDEVIAPLNFHLGVSKSLIKFFGNNRINEIEHFILYVCNVLNISSSGCKHQKTFLDVDLTKRRVGTLINGDIHNLIGGAWMNVCAPVELGVDKAFRHIMETISHELIHLKQYAYGELSTKEGLDGLVRWNWEGGYIDQHKTFEEYLSFPWEREAFYNQCRLVDGWRNRCKALNLKTGLA